MPILSVGEPYVPEIKKWAEGIEYNWRGGQHEIVVRYRNWSKQELDAWKTGKIRLAVYIQQPVIVMLTKPRTHGWSDSPYNYHAVPKQEQQLPPEIKTLPPNQTQAIQFILVEATNGLVKGLRMVGPPRHFMSALHEAIREQARGNSLYTTQAFDGLLNQIFKANQPKQLARKAIASCRI